VIVMSVNHAMSGFVTGLPLMLGLLSSHVAPAAAAESRCAAAFKAESDRIGREAERKAAANPPGKNLESQRQFMEPIHAALKAAADRAQECEERERRAAGPSAPAAIARRDMDCNIRAEQEAEYLKRQREGRKNPTQAEQAALRDAENRIADNRRACMSQGR